MRFLDNQDAFLQSFGIAPVHLPEKQNNSKYSSCQRILRDYREKCKLDIFLHLCRLNYVGHGKIDVTMNTQEACKKNTSLYQVCTLGEQKRMDTPEESFDKITKLSVSLPNDARTRYI